TEAPSGANQGTQRPAAPAFQTTVIGQKGVKWSIPKAINGKFEPNQYYDRVFTAGDRGVSLLFCVNLGQLQPDELACAFAIMRNFNLEYPSERVIRQQKTESNGLAWDHFISNGKGDAGYFRMNIDITCSEGRLVGLIGITRLATEKGAEDWGAGDLHRYITLLPPDPKAQNTEWGLLANQKNSGDILALIGRSYLDRSRNEEAVNFIKAAREVRPNDQLLAEFMLDAQISARHFDDIIGEANALAMRFPKSSGLVWRKAYALGELDRRDEALSEYRRAVFDMGDHSTVCLNAYLSYLCKIDEIGNNLEEVEKLASLNGDPAIQVYLARACLASGESERADKAIDDLVSRSGDNMQLAQAIVGLYLDTGNYEKAHGIARKLSDKDNPVGYYLEAAVYFHEGKYNEARVAAMKSREKLTNDRNVIELIDVINSRLGKADTTLFQNKIDPVPLPDDFASLVPPAQDDFEDDFGAHNEYRGVMYDFEPGKPIRTTRYLRYQVTTLGGIRRMNEISMPFDPLFERIYVNYLRVFDSKGEKIAEGDLANYYVTNSSDEVLMSQKKELHMPIPSLSPGCTVEYAVTYVTLGKQERMMFQLARLASDIPTRLAFAGLRGNTDAVTSATANGAETLPPKPGLIFSYARTPDPITSYSSMPADTAYIPCVWFCATGRTWADECAYFVKNVKTLLEPSPVAAERVKELLGENPTPEDAVRKITAFVRDSLTYQGLLFGVRAMVPNTCETILANRYGDCKDHSYLLMQMLNAAGVKAHLALVDTERNVNIDMPDAFQFNHMIVYLPDFKGGIFIDATDKGLSEVFEPFSLEGCPCLIIDSDNPRIVSVPANPPLSSTIRITRTIDISADGRATVDEKAVFRGLWAGYVRSVLRERSPREYSVALSQSARIPGLFPVKSIETENLDNLDEDMVLRYKFTVALFSRTRNG
ncbi:MAG TPA: DUF3857 domain-containing protein, partial [Opitutales bacterium]|nr:DUF3857 domain-containing protein [Opitutales bacterium]